MKWLVLHTILGSEILMNIENIDCIKETDFGAVVYTSGGAEIKVTESFHEIGVRIK